MSVRTLTTAVLAAAMAAAVGIGIAGAVPATQQGARNAMLLPQDVRAAGLPSSLLEMFEPEFNERIWLCDGSGRREVLAPASPFTFVASTENDRRRVTTETSQGISVFAGAEQAQAAFAAVTARARSCKGTVRSIDEDGGWVETTRRANGVASFSYGGRRAVWTSQVIPRRFGDPSLVSVQYTVFLLNDSVIQGVEFEQEGRVAPRVSPSVRVKVDALAQSLATRWTAAP